MIDTGYPIKKNLIIWVASICLCQLLYVRAGAQTVTMQPTGSIDGHEYVDLGLRVMWATCNVGAAQRTDYGDKFGWGETEKKAEYTAENSATYEKPGHGNILGSTDYDAARAQWGERWRLPTRDEMQELLDSCTWRWTTLDQHEGYLVTSRVNGNTIFLPAAGLGNGREIDGVDEDGNFWTAGFIGSDRAYSLGFYRGHKAVNLSARYYGRSIRPVSTGKVVASAPKVEEKERSQDVAIKVDHAMEIVVPQVNATLNTSLPHEQLDFNGHAYVDLGLSVKWATCNVGAATPFDAGSYFAWGETEVKKYYGSRNSKTLGKRRLNGRTLADISSRDSLDVAREKWGNLWRMPTMHEMEELVNNCTWVYQATNDGRAFYLVMGPKPGSQIIIPLTGSFYGYGPYEVNEKGFYWTSTADYRSATLFNYAYYLYLSDDRINISTDERDIGRTIRPVTDY